MDVRRSLCQIRAWSDDAVNGLSAMIGTCPCGGVTVTLPRKPEYLNSCDCTLCFRLGPPLTFTSLN
jgi:hypothetical protein